MVHRRLRLWSAGRGLDGQVPEPGHAVEMVRNDGVPNEGPVLPGEDRYVGASGHLPEEAGVARSQVAPDVSGHRGDGEDVQPLWDRKGEQEGHGVIHAGVAVDDQGEAGHGSASPASPVNRKRRDRPPG